MTAAIAVPDGAGSSVGHLVCRATVVAEPSSGAAAVLRAEALLHEQLPAALSAAVESVLGGRAEVYVVRRVSCTARGPLSPVVGGALTRALAAGLADAVAGPDVVTFPSVAEYLAYFLGELVAGTAASRWYLHPFGRWAGRPVRDVVRGLHEEHGTAVLRDVWRTLHREGRLTAVLAAAGEAAVAELWHGREKAVPRVAEWQALTRLAVDLVRELGWPVSPGVDPAAVGAELARMADADPDWADPTRLAEAVLRAVPLVALPPDADAPLPMTPTPGWDWVDRDALRRGLDRLRARPAAAVLGEPGLPAPPRAPSPRRASVDRLLEELAEQVRADLAAPGTSPVSTAVALWAALVDRRPDLAGEDWVRAAVQESVERRAVGSADLAPPAPVRSPSPEPGAELPETGGPSPCAGVLLLLRALDSIRLPQLCRRHGLPPGDVLRALALRWAAPATTSDDVAATVAPMVGMSDGSALAAGPLQDLAVAVLETLLAQRRLPADGIRIRAVPFATAGFATVGADAEDLWWPVGIPDRDAADAMHGLWVRAADTDVPLLATVPADRDDPGRDALLAAFDAVRHAHTGVPEVDLPLDLLAVTLLREWASWLRGFARASVPFLLSTFVRRPGHLARTEPDAVVVRLTRATHDVVLEVSGCLSDVEPVSPWTTPPLVRRLEFRLEP